MATTENEINKLARQHNVLKIFYEGCFAMEEYPTTFKPNSLYFLNTSSRESSPVDGHWTVLYVSYNGLKVFFNSAGLPPKIALAEKLLKEKLYVYNKDILQHPSYDSCGRWCLLFGALLARGKSLYDIKANFTEDLVRNEKVLVHLYAREFDHGV